MFSTTQIRSEISYRNERVEVPYKYQVVQYILTYLLYRTGRSVQLVATVPTPPLILWLVRYNKIKLSLGMIRIHSQGVIIAPSLKLLIYFSPWYGTCVRYKHTYRLEGGGKYAPSIPGTNLVLVYPVVLLRRRRNSFLASCCIIIKKATGNMTIFLLLVDRYPSLNIESYLIPI